MTARASASPPDRDARHEQAVHRRLMRFGEAESLATPMWEVRGTTVGAIETQLARLWNTPAADDGSDGLLMVEKGMPHARTSVLNLIVTVVDADAADRVVRTLTNLGIRHPSRAIVLVANPDAAGESLDARISTHCNTGGGAAERICYEEVVLTVRGEAASHLSGIVAPLLIHDLPTQVWWPGSPPFEHPVFAQLVEMADRVIIDSSDFADLLGGLRRLTNVRHRTGVGDLAWERLAWWQELTAQFFDASRFRRYLSHLNRLTISYALPSSDGGGRKRDPREVAPGVSSPISQALLYAGWLASRLGWRRHSTEAALSDGGFRLRLEGRHGMVDLRVEPVETSDVPAGDLVSMHLRSLGEAGASEFIIDRHGDEATVATNADGMTALLRRVSMEPPRETDLLAADLIVDRNDLVYEAALRAAAVLLSSARSADERA